MFGLLLGVPFGSLLGFAINSFSNTSKNSEGGGIGGTEDSEDSGQSYNELIGGPGNSLPFRMNAESSDVSNVDNLYSVTITVILFDANDEPASSYTPSFFKVKLNDNFYTPTNIVVLSTNTFQFVINSEMPNMSIECIYTNPLASSSINNTINLQ